MISNIKQKITASSILTDLVNAVFFGLLSILFGYVKIKMPDFEGVTADFREIPLLISVFYIRSLWPLILICGITALTPSTVNGWTVYFMHYIALVFSWVAYHKFLINMKSDWRRAASWTVVCTIYYLLFIIPLLLIFTQWLSPREEFVFGSLYIRMFELIRYEYVVTALVTTMYLVQLGVRQKLEDHELSLENQVKDRTQALASANDQLQMMNENLDELAIQRSLKIKDQLSTLNKYAHMNSHELRAPLSNILGLVGLLKKKNDEEEQQLLIDSLDESAEKLDEIIKEMNILLEQEMKLPSNKEEHR